MSTDIKRIAVVALFVTFSLQVANQPLRGDDPASGAGITAAELSQKEGDEAQDWDIESPPGPTREQPIDATEGTWINLDVSPSGEQIVFDFLGDLYLMPISGADGTNGQHPQRLTQGLAWDMQPQFSPDGKSIAFTSDRVGKNKRAGDNIWIIDVDGNRLRQVTNEKFRLLNGPAWSPDGQYLVARKHFTSRRSLGAGEMWLYHHSANDTNAMSGVQLTKRPNDQKDVNEPIFSPDGRYLYFSQDTTSGSTFEYDKDSNKQIYVIKRHDMQTGETETYIAGPGGACRPVPSPDGETIAFVRRVGAKTALHLFNTQSGAIRMVYDDLERDMQEAWAIHGVYPSYAWTPDGKSIIVWSGGRIRRIDVATGSEHVIPFHIKDTRQIVERLRFPIDVAPDEIDVKMLRWVRTSPRGDQVAYQALGHIYIRELPDGEPKRLTQQSDHFEFCPSYSRDGRYIVYATWNDEKLGAIRIASVDADAAENWKVTKQPGHYINPVFSPDGQTIVFEKRGGGYLRSSLWSREPGMYRVSARGGDVKRISKNGRRPQFGNHDNRVFFSQSKHAKDADNLHLCSIDLDGHELREHYASQWATDYRVSPDGRWIAFVERFNVFVAPFVETGTTIQIGPSATGIPTTKVSEEAGDWVHFSGDGKKLHWALGPELFTQDLHQSFRFLASNPEPQEGEDSGPGSINISFRHPHAKPSGTYALVGGKIVTMESDEIIEDGTVVVRENRIVAVGSRVDVEVPQDAHVIELDGQFILPGFVDTHAHGSQATSGITPQRNWVDFARLAFGVTTIHDPSNDTQGIFAASEMTKAGVITAPRTFSTGTILYGAAGSFKAEIDSLDDARFHLKRMKAVGAFSVKSYNQPRRDQRQQVVAAARDLQMMVVPEGGSTFMHNMTMIVDGHTGIEHTLPVQSAYDDVMDLWRNTEVGYTPTLCVAYGGISGEQFWYEVDDLWLHPRLQTFTPPHVLTPRARRRNKSPIEDYNHIRVAEIARQVVDQGGLVQAGGHGQLNGICTHWEMWSFVQGGMTPMQALRCGSLLGAKYLGLDGDLGSIKAGKLADLIVFEAGADPTKEIRDSERIQYVMANGRMFEARRMNELGANAPRQPFYWEQAGHGVSLSLPRVTGCGCQRPGSTAWWAEGE